MNLQALIPKLHEAIGIRQKQAIQVASRHLNRQLTGEKAVLVGDDCAVIPDENGSLLFAIEGFIPEFLRKQPWFAGYCAVMVNVSDIAAMGGRPIAVVDAFWMRDEAEADEIWAGMVAASEKYGVPIVGGHTHLKDIEARDSCSYLATAILGRANTTITSFDARPSDVLIAAIDMRAKWEGGPPCWNASTQASGERLRGDIALLPEIAEANLVTGGKDISMGGLVGTAMMLAEASEIGISIDLNQLHKPDHVNWFDWLTAFPSFGYLFTAPAEHADAICERFKARDIWAGEIGSCLHQPVIDLIYENEKGRFWDFESADLTGFTGASQSQSPQLSSVENGV